MHHDSLPWHKINAFILEIGKERTPWGFSKKIVDRISDLIPFDTAILYLLGEDEKPFEQVLIGIEPEWSEVYLDYYSRLSNNRFSYLTPSPAFITWKEIEDCEYISDFIRPQRVHSTATLIFFDSNHRRTGALCINRKGKCGFTENEKHILGVIRAHIVNLHANFFVSTVQYKKTFNFFNSKGSLTKRESQIVDLLCKGVTPQIISTRLFISVSTVNRHIANIHKKLNVSSRQEMLVKMLNR